MLGDRHFALGQIKGNIAAEDVTSFPGKAVLE